MKNISNLFITDILVKECVRKCIGKNVRFIDIITSHKNSGPQVMIKNKPEYDFRGSISHEKNIAIAVVLCEKLT